ncbi:MAG: hypothetical protein ABIY51_11455 [Ferruginibacter sp.]
MAGKKLKYLLAACCIIALGIGIYAYKEYNRKTADLANTEALYQTTASVLIDAYSSQEDAANRKYLGKVIQVKGTVVEVTNQQDTVVAIMLGDTAHSSRVSCTVDKNHIAAAKKYTIGNLVSIKGICTGYLMDVELNGCLIVE